MRNIAICDVYNYEFVITTILILFSLLNAFLYLNEQNLVIYFSTIIFFVLYKTFIAKKGPGMSSECQKQEEFIEIVRDMNDMYKNNNNNNGNGNSNSNSKKNN